MTRKHQCGCIDHVSQEAPNSKASMYPNSKQTLSSMLWQQLRREWIIQMRQKKSWINSLLFFAMILFFFPLTLPADPLLERVMVPGLVWVALLLAYLLAAERLFQVDYDEGVLELWLISGQPLTVFISAKVWVHWVLMIVPLLGLIPVIMLLFQMSIYVALALFASVVCGSFPIILLSALAAAFATVLPQKGVLMGLIVLPLAIPVLILGAATTTAAMAALPIAGYLAYLSALSCICLAALPCAIAGVIKASL